MKSVQILSLFILFVTALGVTSAQPGQIPQVSAESAADIRFRDIDEHRVALTNTPGHDPVPIIIMILDFYLDFPADSRGDAYLNDIVSLEAGAHPDGKVTADAGRYQEVLKEQLASILARSTLSDTQRLRLMQIEIKREVGAQKRADTPDVAQLRQLIDGLYRLNGNQHDFNAEVEYLELLATAAPDQVAGHLETLTRDPDGKIALMARGRMNRHLAVTTPLELSFVSLEGRKIDFRRLRGKVVVLDFWATWCPSCVEQLPIVHGLYDTFHRQGLEVIGISMDSNRQKLKSFLKKNPMPWPQYYDGKGWNNEVVVRFGVTAAPTLFLLDRKGRIVLATHQSPVPGEGGAKENARIAEVFSREIARLLAL